MLSTFRKFVGFKILEYFLSYPTKEIYLNELAKKLNVSSGSIKNYCDLFRKKGLINREIKGNTHLFSTNNDKFFVRETKRAYTSLLLMEMNIEDIANNVVSIAVYGSHASGNYDENSDIDILIIGEEKNVNRDRIIKIMDKIGKEIQLNVFSTIQWEKMKGKNDPFVRSVLTNHILVKGVEL